MPNYIDIYMNIRNTAEPVKAYRTAASAAAAPALPSKEYGKSNILMQLLNAQGVIAEASVRKTEKIFSPEAALPSKEYGKSNILMQLLNAQGVIAEASAGKTEKIYSPAGDYKHNLRSKFKNNDAVIMGVIIRSLGAENRTGNQLIRKGDIKGTLVNGVNKLDERKALGINTLHVLPVHPPGKYNAMGTAGSVYAPEKFVEKNGDLAIDPEIIDENPPKEAWNEIAAIYKEKTGRNLIKMDKNDQDVRYAQFKYFVNQCHNRGIDVMLDLPSCASFDLYNARPDLMAFEKDGTPKTPGGWNDIRMFDPWEDESKRILNKGLLQMHKDFVDSCIKLGVDGIRADVSRTKPTEFWDILTHYSREKQPEFAWLAESYTYEDASPQLNMNYDRPQDALNAGFDSFYGQYHIFHELDTASKVIDYVKENLAMSKELDYGKSLIGSFGTHDDISIMNHGGVTYSNLVSGVQAALPMLNPYYFDGYQTGDYYNYDFYGKTDNETSTDSNECTVHKSKPDIFNLSRPLIGKNPEIGDFMKNTLEVRSNPKYHTILTKGSFIPLKKDGDASDQIIAFARHWHGKTLVFVGNKDVNGSHSCSIQIPGLKSSQQLNNLFKSYGEDSIFQADKDRLNAAKIGKGRVHLFEVDTPDIEKTGIDVFRQKL